MKNIKSACSSLPGLDMVFPPDWGGFTYLIKLMSGGDGESGRSITIRDSISGSEFHYEWTDEEANIGR